MQGDAIVLQGAGRASCLCAYAYYVHAPPSVGVIHYNDAKIQLLDLPGVIEGASQGKGKGRQVIAVCKSADLLLMVLDAGKPWYHKVASSHQNAARRWHSG